MSLQSIIGDGIMDRATTAASGIALTTPWWWPALQGISETAAAILPILGGIWLAVKIVTTIDHWWRERKTPPLD